MQAAGSDNISKAYNRAAKEVRRYPLLIYDKDRLQAVNGFGPATVAVRFLLPCFQRQCVSSHMTFPWHSKTVEASTV